MRTSGTLQQITISAPWLWRDPFWGCSSLAWLLSIAIGLGSFMAIDNWHFHLGMSNSHAKSREKSFQ